MQKFASLLICFLLLFGGSASAQQSEFDVILAKPISVSGSQRFEAVCQQVSQQTGVTVVPSDSLKMRQLTIAMEKVSLRAFLDAVSDLYGWTWKRETDTAIRIKRAPVPEISQVNDLPQAFAKVLPVDMRGLLMLGLVPKNGLTAEQMADPLQNDTSVPDITKRMHVLPQRILPRMGQHYDELIATLDSEQTGIKTYPYEKLSASQKEDVLAYFILSAMRSLSPPLLYNLLAPYQRTAEECSLEIKGANFMIGSYERQGMHETYRGFGKSVPTKE
jgi:hypothetical protein